MAHLASFSSGGLKFERVNILGSSSFLLLKAVKIIMNPVVACPHCQLPSQFSAKRQHYFCAECELAFDAPKSRGGGQLFLSYGHDPECTELARLLRQRLEPEFTIWMDEIAEDERGIRFGDDWRQRVADGIRSSDYMLALLSAHSTRKPGVCREEVALAIGPLKGYVYSVLVQPLSEVMPPLILSQRQWLDMSEWRDRRNNPGFDEWFEQQIGKIVSALREKSGFAGEMAELHRALKPLSQVSHHTEVERGFVGRQWLLGRLGEGRPLAGSLDNGDDPLGEIERWVIDEPSKRVFWLCADPGWGKSAVMGRLAHAQRARVLAVHFCRHDEADTRQPHRVISSLAYQMASQLPDYRSQLLEVVRDRTDWESASAGDLFRQLIQEPLACTIDGGRAMAETFEGQAAGQHHRRLIVIDALDECVDENGRSELLDVLSERFRALPNWLGLVVSSRREIAVVSRFRGFGMFELHAFDDANRDDLRLYAQAWLQRLVGSGQLPAEQYPRALESVCAVSAGNFLYLKQLEIAVMQEQMLETQELLSPETLPANLGAMYSRWFERKFKMTESYETTALPLLQLMLAAREPLPLDLVDKVLGWDERRRAKARAALGSLVREEFGCLQFFHKRVADWLRDEVAAGPNWVVSETKGHMMLAGAMGREWERASLRKLQSGSLAPSQYFADWEAEARIYAMRHFPHHLLKSGERDRCQEVLTDFAFAMQRCRSESLEWFLADYRDARPNSQGTSMAFWADAICQHAYQLRGGLEMWPAYRSLLQLAMSGAKDSALTQAAKDWMERGYCNWVWMPRSTRYKRVRSDRQNWIEQTIHIGDHGRLALAAVDVCWGRFPTLVACAMAAPRGGEGLVRVFDLSTGLLVWQADLPQGKIQKIFMHDDTAEVIVQMASGLILQGGLDSNDPLIEISTSALTEPDDDSGHSVDLAMLPAKVSRFVQSGDATLCLAACEDGSLWRWSPNSGERPAQLTGPGPKIYDLAITRDGRVAASVGEGRGVTFWCGDGRMARLPGHAYRATKVLISDDGSRALSAGQDGMIIVWNLAAAALASAQTFAPEVTALTVVQGYTEGEALVLSGDIEGMLRKRSQSSMSFEGQAWQGHTGRVWGTALTPCGCFLVSAGADLGGGRGSADGSVAVWEVASQRCLARHTSKREMQAIAVSPHGKYLVTASADGQLAVWDLVTVLSELSFESAELAQVRTPAAIRSILFLDANRFFSAGGDGVIRAWSISDDGRLTGDGSMNHGRVSEARVLQGSSQIGAYALALSPCKGFLACSGRGLHRAITIWRLQAPEAPFNVLFENRRGNLRGVHTLSFMNDGEHLLSASWDESILLWEWRDPGGRQILCQPEQYMTVLVPAKTDNQFVLGTALGDIAELNLLNSYLLRRA